MCPREFRSFVLQSGPHFFRGETIAMRRQTIVDPNGIRHGLRPETEDRVFRPTYSSVNHIGACHVANGTYGIFGKRILMFCTNSTKSQLLLHVLTVVPEFLRVEHSIVCMDTLDGVANVCSLPLEK
jgi:hypothetical protein